MTPLRRVLRIFYAATLLIACASSATAQTLVPAVEDQIKDLQAQLDKLKSSYGIQDDRKTDPEHDWDPKPQSPLAAPPAKPASKPPEKKTFPNAKLTGFFQADVVFARGGTFAATGACTQPANREKLAASEESVFPLTAS